MDDGTLPRLHLNHRQFLQLMAAALAEQEYEYMGSAIGEWLQIFPGDLQTHLFNGCLSFALGKNKLARRHLEKLVELEPFFLPAYLTYQQMDKNNPFINGCILALGGAPIGEEALPLWAPVAHTFMDELEAVNEPALDEALPNLLQFSGESVLVDLFHLLYAMKFQPDDAVLVLARLYHDRWPNALQFKLILADYAIKKGDEILGIELLQECVKSDLAGLSAKRLWGANHAYRHLWPMEDELSASLVVKVPTPLLTRLGINQLTSGTVVDEANSDIGDDLTNFEASLELPRPNQKDYTSPVSNNDEVISIFEKVSTSLGKKSPRKVDGRFPVYVIVTCRGALEHKYGPESASIIFGVMKNLVSTISQAPGWSAMVFTPDDKEGMRELGLELKNPKDPWQIKLALNDLDQQLAKKGSMIGALLIVGGNDIVPFHQLPNPTDDNDTAILSDNPYGSIDENYFIPEWPVGRMPDENTNDPGLLLLQLRGAIRDHATPKSAEKKSVLPFSFSIEVLVEFFTALFGGKPETQAKNSIGYSAAIWRRSSIAAYRPIGSANLVIASPPITSPKLDKLWLSETEFAYFNLHGIEDGAEWFGQKDFVDASDGPDYPVALQPTDISPTPRYRQIIFSEACYGGYIESKNADQSIALRYITSGCKGFIGSTAIAYGSIQPPLIGADLLAFLFWKRLQEGYAQGDALMRAKVELAQEMQKRQNFLDGEDQKTLLSFVLYGDPLSRVKGETGGKISKIERERISDQIIIFSETDITAHEPLRISDKTIAEVKQVLSAYLPGLVESDYDLYQQFVIDSEGVHSKFRMGAPEKLQRHESGNVVMSFQKETIHLDEKHRYFAKVTVNTDGRVIKLAVSR